MSLAFILNNLFDDLQFFNALHLILLFCFQYFYLISKITFSRYQIKLFIGFFLFLFSSYEDI